MKLAQLVALCLVFLTVTGLAQGAQKNIVVLVADDLGWQLGCYGDPDSKTPHLDRLAAEGTRFTRAYCTTASCSASRSVILTGQYNHATAHYGHAHGDGHFSTFANVRTLPVILKEAGYRTCSIGKYHVEPEATYHFDHYLNDGPAKDTHNPVGMAQNVRKFIAESGERPFFVYFCGTDAHRSGKGFANDKPHEGVTPQKYDPAKITLPAWLPDLPESRAEWADFLEAVNRWDQGVGAVVQALTDTGHLDDTLILTLSDNGPPFPGAKTTTYEPGIKLPLIVRHPQQQRRGVVTDAGVNWADLAPTILDFAGVKAPGGRVGKNGKVTGGMHGRSFLAALEKEHVADRDDVYFSHTFHEVQMYYPMRGVVAGRYKYIYNIAAPLPYPFASDLYASKTWQAVLTGGVKQYGQRTTAAYLHRSTHELYDLQADPHETRNLAAESQHAETLKQLQAKVKTFQQQTNDPWFSKWTYE